MRIIAAVGWLLIAATVARAINATGSLAAGTSVGAAPSHGWIAIPEPEGSRCAVLYVPPRGLISPLGPRGGQAGDVRVATTVGAVPVALGSIGAEVAMVFDDSSSGFPNLKGRPVLSLAADEFEPGVWRPSVGQRLDSLPSLRADGLLLGFAGSPVGYTALMQGLTGEGQDPQKIVLFVLRRDGWVEVPVPPELQTLAVTQFEVRGDRPATNAHWRLASTLEGVAVAVVPPRNAADPIAGSVFLADFSGSPREGVPSATWTRRDLTLAVSGSAPTDQVNVIGAAGHLVMTLSAGDGKYHVYTQPLQSPTPWRRVATLSNIAPLHAPFALDGSGRMGLVSIARTNDPERPDIRLAEVSVRTGDVVYEGPIRVASPISRSDYRSMAVAMAWVLGLIVVFLWRPTPKEALHLPPGVSIAEPGRRMLAATIDGAIGVLIACRVTGLPVLEFVQSGIWANAPAQDTLVIAIGTLIVMSTVLETLFGRTLGKMLAGCGVVEMVRGLPAKDQVIEPKAPIAWRALVRNLVKWGLPPVALFGLLDPAGRHRADQFAGTAVVIEGEPDEDAGPEE